MKNNLTLEILLNRINSYIDRLEKENIKADALFILKQLTIQPNYKAKGTPEDAPKQ